MDPMTAPDFWDRIFSLGPGYVVAIVIAAIYRKEISAMLMAPRGDAEAAKMLGVMTEQFGSNLAHFEAVQAATERAAKATEDALPVLRSIDTELKIQNARGNSRR